MILVLLALLIGIAYGFVSVKGQFCMNSGFSNVFRQKDTTKLKSFLTAILIQLLVLPILFSLLYQFESTYGLVQHIGLPPLYLIGAATGGFLFGIMMYYAAGCGAGIFYKIGEKNTGALIASIGFIAGVYLTEKSALSFIRKLVQNEAVIHQTPFWKTDSALLISLLACILSSITLFFLLRTKSGTPKGAIWNWKKTGISIGIIGLLGWAAAILVKSHYGMAIIPGAIDLVEFNYTWGLMFLLGIPLGSLIVTWKKKEKKFTLPSGKIILKRFLAGIGLGISGSIAAGCTVGHGLTFTPLLGIGSTVALIFIFLGSGMMGYLTRK